MYFLDRVVEVIASPIPVRSAIFRRLIRRFPIGSYSSRLRAGAVDRPWYGWCLYNAALEAKLLGLKAMTAVEMGVAGGRGLVCLCNHRDEIQRELGIEILIQGFDTGVGLPKSDDPRDLLFCWPAGSFKMDFDRLRTVIGGRAELVLGDVATTVSSWKCRPDASRLFRFGFLHFDKAGLATLSHSPRTAACVVLYG